MPLIVAHRGASYAAPENTMPAFRLAIAEKAEAIEADFQLTSDNKIVCIHNNSTAKMVPHEKPLSIKDSTLEELKRLDFGIAFDEKYKGTRIPTLAEILAILPENMKFILEIKDEREEIINLIKDELDTYGIEQDRVVFVSFFPGIIISLKKMLPEIKRFWNYGWYLDKKTEKLSNEEDEIIDFARRIGAAGIDINRSNWVGRSFAQKAKEAKLGLSVYTVDTLTDAVKYISLGFDMLISNRPVQLKREIEEYYKPLTADSDKAEKLIMNSDGSWEFFPER